MRKGIPVLLVLVLLAVCACNEGGERRGVVINAPESEGLIIRHDSIAQLMASYAASDFYNHNPPDAIQFRNTYLGSKDSVGSNRFFVICGEFRIKKDNQWQEWNSFATVKTAPYEQWLGSQSASFCTDPRITWEKTADLSQIIAMKFDSLNKK